MSFDGEDLELAFQLHCFDRVVAADQVTTEAERRFRERCFPADVLLAAGFVDPATGERTERFHAAITEALLRLPRTLDRSAKHDLLDAVFRLAIVDRTFRLGEGAMLLQASRWLGLPDDDFDRFLAARPAAMGVTVELLERGS